MQTQLTHTQTQTHRYIHTYTHIHTHNSTLCQIHILKQLMKIPPGGRAKKAFNTPSKAPVGLG